MLYGILYGRCSKNAIRNVEKYNRYLISIENEFDYK